MKLKKKSNNIKNYFNKYLMDQKQKFKEVFHIKEWDKNLI